MKKFCLLFLGWTLAVFAQAGLPGTSKLQVGSLTISEYEINKAYTFHLGIEKKPRNPASLQAWFPLYSAQLRAIARARDLGYFAFPEVVDDLYRMERNMLSSPTLLLPDFLAANIKHWTNTDTKPDKEMIVVSRVVIEERSPAGANEKNRPETFAAAFERPVISYERGLVLNQTDCGADARRQLEAAEAGACVVEALPNGHLAYWRKDSTFPPDALSHVASFFASPDSVHRRNFRLRWPEYIETRIRDYTVDDKWLGQEGPQLLGALSDSASSETVSSEHGRHILASYRIDETRYTVTFDELMDYSRRLYFKRPVKTVEGLCDLLRAYVAEDFTYHSSLSFGVLQQEKVQNDKMAYRHTLALEAYQKREIDPKIDFSTDVLQAWYDAHLALFTKPSYVDTEVYIFETKAAAIEGFHALLAAASDPTKSASPQGMTAHFPETRVLHDDAKISDNFRRRLWAAPAGQILPPGEFDGKQAVLKKRGHGGAVVEPFDAVRDTVVLQVRKERRKILLNEHAATLAAAYPLSVDPALQIREVGPLVPPTGSLAQTASPNSELRQSPLEKTKTIR